MLGAGLGAASGLSIFGLGACNKSDSSGGSAASGPAKAASCADKGEIDEAAANLRKVLQYKEKTDNPEKKCNSCAQYEAGKYGDCGGCKLFGGGVHPDGHCLSFAPKTAAPAPGAAPGAPAAPGAAPAPAPGAAPAPAGKAG